jgi:hypothetical protein
MEPGSANAHITLLHPRVLGQPVNAGRFEISLAMPRQRPIVVPTSVRLGFGPDNSLECPHAPSPSVINQHERSQSMKANRITHSHIAALALLSSFILPPSSLLGQGSLTPGGRPRRR